MIVITKTTQGLCFNAYVQPRASRTAIAGSHEGALKIKLTAPPVGGAANKQCCQVLAKALALPRSNITITKGHSSRRKGICLKLKQDDDPQKESVLKKRIQKLANHEYKKTA